MKITTKGKYGLRMLVAIAASGSTPISLKNVAVSLNASEKYLEQLIIPLIKSGYVASVRGAQGGYTLNHKPEDINLKELLELLEGKQFLQACVGEKGECSRSQECPLVDTFKRINDAAEYVLLSTTVADLIKSSKEITEKQFVLAGQHECQKPACKN